MLHTDRHTDTETNMQNTDTAQYTVLGWVKRLSNNFLCKSLIYRDCNKQLIMCIHYIALLLGTNYLIDTNYLISCVVKLK